MTTTTRSIGVRLVLAAARLAAHLADHALPEPVSLEVETRSMRSELTVQLRSTTLPTVAGELLTWAGTLTTVTAQAWRVPHGDRIHLSITSALTGSAPTVELEVFGGMDHDPKHFADLEPGKHRVIPLAQLRTWASSVERQGAE
jgi:hypothetical protein